jgi:molybdopterin synthase sulfur carrier subunit
MKLPTKLPNQSNGAGVSGDGSSTGARGSGYNRKVTSVSQTLRVKVLFFGRLKEIAGLSEELLDVPSGASIESLFAAYAARHLQLSQYRSSVVASRNQEFAAWDTRLHSGDEVAFLPPVSGG